MVRILRESIQTLKESGLTVDKLYDVARARVCISAVANHLADAALQTSCIPLDIWDVIESARQLGQQTEFKLLK